MTFLLLLPLSFPHTTLPSSPDLLRRPELTVATALGVSESFQSIGRRHHVTLSPYPSWLFTLGVCVQQNPTDMFSPDAPAVNSPLHQFSSVSLAESLLFRPTPTSKKKTVTVYDSACRTRHIDRSSEVEARCSQDLCGLQLLPMYVPCICSPIPTGEE